MGDDDSCVAILLDGLSRKCKEKLRVMAEIFNPLSHPLCQVQWLSLQPGPMGP